MVGVGHQDLHHLKFLVCQPEAAGGGGQGEGGPVKGHVSQGKLRFGQSLSTTDHPDPGQQFLGVKGLGHIVVGAAVQAQDFVVHLGFGGEHDDGDPVSRFPEGPQNGDAVQLWHHHIQDRHVVIAGFQITQCVGTVVHRVSAVMVLFQNFHHSPFQGNFIFCQKDSHIHTSLSWISCPYYRPGR